MPEKERPLDPRDRTKRISENEVNDMRRVLESWPTRKLQLLLIFFQDPPAEDEVTEAYRGTAQEGYPYEELLRIFKLNEGFIQDILRTRTDLVDDILSE